MIAGWLFSFAAVAADPVEALQILIGREQERHVGALGVQVPVPRRVAVALERVAGPGEQVLLSLLWIAWGGGHGGVSR